MKQDRSMHSLPLFEQSIALIKELYEHNPTHEYIQSLLINTYREASIAYHENHHIEKAFHLANQSLLIAEEVEKQNQHNLNVIEDLITVYHSLFILHKAQGEDKKAQEYLTKRKEKYNYISAHFSEAATYIIWDNTKK